MQTTIRACLHDFARGIRSPHGAILFLLAAQSATLWAGDAKQIRGTVLDSSGAVIQQAAVTLQSGTGIVRSSTNTSDTGTFALPVSDEARAFLQIEAPGFTTFRKAINPAATEDLKVVLGVVGLPQQIAVVGTGYLEDLDNSARATSVLNRETLEQRLEFSIAESLREVPGVRITQSGGPGAITNIRIRGLRGQDTAVLIDGMRFRDPAATQSDASAFTAELLTVNISRLEVLKGCGSSLYGSNAMGGVVNIVSDSGGGRNRGDILFEGGGLGFLRSQLRTSGGLAKDRFTYSLGLAHLNVLDGVDGDDRARNSGMQMFSQFRATKSLLLSARVSANNSFVGLNFSPSLTTNAPSAGFVQATPLPIAQQQLRNQSLPFALGDATVFPAGNDPDSRRVSWLTSALFAADQQISARTSLRAAYQVVDTRRGFPNGPAGIGFQPRLWETSTFNGRIDTLQARLQHVADKHLLSGGIEYEREAFDNGGISRLVTGDSTYRAQVSQRGWSAFAEDRWRILGDRLQLTASGRLQTFQLQQPKVTGELPGYLRAGVPSPPNAFTGDISLLYRLTGTNTKLRGHVGNSYRAPSLYERYGTGFFGGNFTPYGDPRLKPEQSIGGDFGIDQYIANRRARISATYFYTQLESVVGFDFSGLINRTTDPFGRSSGYYSTNGGLARGVEVETEVSPWRGMRWTASYTHTRTLERRAVALGTLLTPRIFAHSASASAIQTYRRLTLTSNFLWASEFIGVISGRAIAWQGPHRLDATAAFRLGDSERFKPELFGRVENLLGQQFYDDGFRTPNRYGLAGIRISY